MSTPHPLMAQIPDELLWVGPRSDRSRIKRAAGLLRWLERHDFRPTFLELEDERQRRREGT